MKNEMWWIIDSFHFCNLDHIQNIQIDKAENYRQYLLKNYSMLNMAIFNHRSPKIAQK